ncbi:MAG: prsT [Chthonomonadales bacterium]|nr:prsT [Chthonomonadales bacterium]
MRAAIAEAHFRRALGTRISLPDAATDLRHAIDLLPDEARFWYQLGLMLHRSDQLEEACQAYARAADLGWTRRGMGVVRGLAELEADPEVSLDILPWLTPEARTALEPIARLLAGNTEVPPALATGPSVAGTSGVAEPVTALWKGLTLLAHGAAAEAYAALSPTNGQRLPVGAEPVRAFYFGVAAALAGKSEVALTAWREMERRSPQAAAARPPHFDASISQVASHRILSLQQEGRWEESLRQSQTSSALAPGDPWLHHATLLAANRLATAARDAGEWAGAVEHWQIIRSLLETHPNLGSLPPILHNLAVAYEALEEWEDAAEAWAALLNTFARRRGRAPAKPTPETEGVSVEEKSTWIRRRILDNYKRAELPEEAITYYKKAVKAEPENLDLRVEMASALLANDQSIAARNEVQRILDKDPKYVGALLLLAEIHHSRYEYYAAEQALIRVLNIDPSHEVARKALVQRMRERGSNTFNAGRHDQAREIYQQALKYAPNDPELLVFVGQSELVVGRAKQAQPYFDAALATRKPEAYLSMFLLWGRAHKEESAREILQGAEEAGVADSQFYLRVGVICLTMIAHPVAALSSRIPKAPPRWEEWGRELIETGLERVADQAEALEDVLTHLQGTHPAIAVEYAQRLVALKPEDPEVLLDLAFCQGLAKDVKGAKATLTQAERVARKQGRKDLLEPIARMRQEIGSPYFGMFGSLFGPGGLDIDDLDMEDFR